MNEPADDSSEKLSGPPRRLHVVERWVVPFAYRIAVLAARVVVRVYLPRTKVEGTQNVPTTGPLIVVCNHLSYADPAILLARTPRRVVFLAMEPLFQLPLLGCVPLLLGAVPVPDRGPAAHAMRAALDALRRGLAVVVFPEGEISRTARLQPGAPGAALLAYRAGCPIIPVAVSGSERVLWPRVLLHPFRGPSIRMRFGTPFRLPPVERVDHAAAREATALVMRQIGDLLPPGYRT